MSDEGNSAGPAAKPLTLGEAAKAIGVSTDTLRRWDAIGRIETTRDSRGRRLVSPTEVERLTGRPSRPEVGSSLSARNRFSGVIRSVEVDGVMALVELDANGQTVVAAITRDSVEELGLAPGVHATAAVKATSIMIQRDPEHDR